MTYQARQYATALFDLLQENGKEELEKATVVLRSFKHAREKDENIRHFLDNPNIPFEKKKVVISEAFKKELPGHPVEAIHTVMLMTKNLDLYKLSKTIYTLKQQTNKRFDILEVKIHSPHPLPGEQKQQLKDMIRKQQKTEHIIIREKINPSLLAGFILQIRDSVIDGTVKGRLRQILS